MSTYKSSSIRLDDTTRQKLDVLCKKSRRSLNQEILLIIENYLEKYEEENGKILEGNNKSL